MAAKIGKSMPEPTGTIWDPERECMDRESLRALQLERLKAVVQRVETKVPFHRERFKAVGVSSEQIRSLDDLRRLPFSSKEHMREAYPYGLFAVPTDELARIHSSSGTTGKPTVVGYTARDLETWANLVARFLTAGGLTPADVVQVAFGYGLFTGGFGLHYGIEKVGAAVIPASSGNTRRQIGLMVDLNSTALVCTPTYALHIAEVLEDIGLTGDDLSLRIGLFGAEPWSPEMRRAIEERLCISATDNYGLSEVIGPGVSGECQHKNGLHLFEDHFIAEIIDPETTEPLPMGEEGELVLTTLTREAMPMIRFRTRDICRLDADPCPCGRTSLRMSRVTGRTDDMLIIRGVNVFPSQIESVLLEIEGTKPHYRLLITREGALDAVELQVEVSKGIFADEMKELRALERRIEDRLRNVLSISPKVTLVEPRTIERSLGKAKRVIDERPAV